MNLPRYQFHSHSESNLLLFLKTANNHKNELYCDLNEYEKAKLLCPLGKKIKEKLKTYHENVVDVIEIISDDEFMGCNDDDLKKEINGLVEDLTTLDPTKTNVQGLVEIISGCLIMHEEIPTTVLRDLLILNNETLEETFKCLCNIINLEQAEFLWGSIDSLHESLILGFIKIIFLQKATQEYKNSVSDMFIKFSNLYSSFFLKELTRKCIEDDINQVLPKYLMKLKSEFKTLLLRNIIAASNKLESKSISIIEVLLDSSDKTTLTQLLELMCNSAMEFTQDNSYGKLLFGIVSHSESLIPSWGSLLKDILNVNQSIWKIKVQKIISNHMNDTLGCTFS